MEGNCFLDVWIGPGRVMAAADVDRMNTTQYCAPLHCLLLKLLKSPCAKHRAAQNVVYTTRDGKCCIVWVLHCAHCMVVVTACTWAAVWHLLVARQHTKTRRNRLFVREEESAGAKRVPTLLMDCCRSYTGLRTNVTGTMRKHP